MNDIEHDIYYKFIEWLKQSWYGVPDSDVLLSYVAARYTTEEAALLTGMPFSPKTLAELSELTGIDDEKLRGKLDSLVAKGLVYKQIKEGQPRYHLNDIFSFTALSAGPAAMTDTARSSDRCCIDTLPAG